MTSSLILDRAAVSYPVFTASRHQSVLTAAAGLLSFGKVRRDVEGIKVVDAIRGISLNLSEGARVGLIGRNGSGKSTLLRLLAGIHLPTRGKRTVKGRISTVLSHIAGLDAEKSGRENVAFICRIFGLSSAQSSNIINEIETFVELGEFFDMPLRTYSAGMQVRISFALATTMPGEILLIDEVLAAGDAHFMTRAAERLQKRAAEARIMVLATHSPTQLFEFCDLAIWLDSGEIVACGKPEEVWAQYAAAGEEIPPPLKRAVVTWPSPSAVRQERKVG
ncbi:teichoic acids export ATP-binding protein TagH [Candidatus Phycosocius bacilliformis]|uniref:Teichoic acids export ATP-binding protein TagH n=1 Tax=Candidatus Phycosocius bacilliformis TaxID=1445552 RepID=A0A2P2E6F4_9PROT|nr:ATP-binding cassette domain-containing protein [Candidatus Phycosocius bacilliformis]GBF56655.1 teichoic acids export ATP-binding protein TagH [Candidatus Phycosocius bacilliformis]